MSRQMVLIISGMITMLVMVVMLGVGATVAIQSTLAARMSNALVPAANTNTLQPIAAMNTTNVTLSADQAASIAQKTAPTAKITATPELINLQGTIAYEVKLNNGVIYIDANNGTVLYNSTASAAPATSGTKRKSEHSEKSTQNIKGEHND